MLEHREQGHTRQEILDLLRRRGQMTAAELSESLGIGAVGVRQHIALLERDGLVQRCRSLIELLEMKMLTVHHSWGAGRH